MSMSTALNNALGGLSAASRGAAVVSGNIANALTPGYAKRTLELATSQISGNGVQVVGVTRHHDPVLAANLRAADADLALNSAIADFHSRFEALVGTPDDAASVSARLVDFENSLITAASNPGSAERLDQVARSGDDLARALNDASEGLREMRSDADRKIGSYVETLNTTLKDIEDLNARIPAVQNAGGDINGLLDRRQVLIDQVNELIPVNVVARDNNRVSLYSDGGLILLEGSAAEFAFTTTGDTKPHMTIGNGLLSGLEINGQPVRTSGENAQIRGGALMAQFQIRDELSIEAQVQLDAVAQDLIERFETPGLDPTAMARVAQISESEFVGCQCGIMDQLVSTSGAAGHAVLIDCAELTTRAIPLPADLAVMIVHSGISRGLVDGEYNTRRAQCEQAAAQLGVAQLRDADLQQLEQMRKHLPDTVFRRARHVITENARTLAAADCLAGHDLAGLRELMMASHASMKNDFEITVPGVDELVGILQDAIGEAGGARMTGGGFGGAVVALLPATQVAQVTAAVRERYRTPAGQPPEVMIEQAAAGAGPLTLA